MMKRLYTAAPIAEGNPAIDLSKKLGASWILVGLYIFLSKNPPATVAEIINKGYGISSAIVAQAINELIDQGLVNEQIVEEVQHESH